MKPVLLAFLLLLNANAAQAQRPSKKFSPFDSSRFIIPADTATGNILIRELNAGNKSVIYDIYLNDSTTYLLNRTRNACLGTAYNFNVIRDTLFSKRATIRLSRFTEVIRQVPAAMGNDKATIVFLYSRNLPWIVRKNLKATIKELHKTHSSDYYLLPLD